MLLISDVGDFADYRTSSWEWHVGEPLPPSYALTGVIQFQADGHELQLLLLAMQRGYVGPGGRVALAEDPHA